MLQIRLSKPANEIGASVKPAPVDTVTVACPDHLVLADLPVAKSLGAASANAPVKIIGRRSRRQLGERVHFCVRCDFPIAIYGRLSPCEHAFCLDCARSDSLCYLCDERIQKIQTIKMMEGIFICAAPHCLKSFLKKSEFESHINEIHADLLHPGKERDGNESEAMSARKSSMSDSTVQAPPRDPPPTRPVMQPRPMPMPPYSGQAPNRPLEQHSDGNQSHAYDRTAPQNQFPQQSFDPRQDPVNPNPVMPPPQFGYGAYASDGTPQFFSAQEAGPGGQQGSVLGFQPGPAGSMNFPQNYPQPWSMVPGSVPLEPPMLPKGSSDSFMNLDPQARGFFQGGNYGQNVVGTLPSNVPAPASNNPDQRQGGNYADGKGILASQPMHVPQVQRGRLYTGDGNHEPPPGFGWQSDSFGGGQD